MTSIQISKTLFGGLIMLTISVMDNPNWTSQALFIEWVKRFAEANGYVTKRGAVDIPAVAALFRISESNLRQCLHYKNKHRLGYDTLVFIAGVIGCSVNDFTGAPSKSPPGIAQKEWAIIPEGDRLFASMVIDDVMADNLTSTEKTELFGIYREAKARMIRMRK
jgi:hypothetical protein